MKLCPDASPVDSAAAPRKTDFINHTFKLPPELLYAIAERLPLHSTACLAATCRTMKAIFEPTMRRLHQSKEETNRFLAYYEAKYQNAILCRSCGRFHTIPASKGRHILDKISFQALRLSMPADCPLRQATPLLADGCCSNLDWLLLHMITRSARFSQMHGYSIFEASDFVEASRGDIGDRIWSGTSNRVACIMVLDRDPLLNAGGYSTSARVLDGKLVFTFKRVFYFRRDSPLPFLYTTLLRCRHLQAATLQTLFHRVFSFPEPGEEVALTCVVCNTLYVVKPLYTAEHKTMAMDVHVRAGECVSLDDPQWKAFCSTARLPAV